MDRETELNLIDEFLDLKSRKSAFLDETIGRQPVRDYTDQARFDLEREKIFLTQPVALAHVSELAGPGDFLKKQYAGRSILLTRTKSGEVKAFHNVCRHRGTALVSENKGCKHRFTCPYHAWTYANSGELIAAPHFEQGFGELSKSDLGLKSIACQEAFGFIWINLATDAVLDMETYFGALAQDIHWLSFEDHVIADETARLCHANWKILVEGGIESYHFKVAHKHTIGPYFEDNMSTYRMFGHHMLSMLPRSTLANMAEQGRDKWNIRDHANLLYTFFPGSQVLVQQDHMIWISSRPMAPDKTELRMVTLVPKAEAHREDYWRKNHHITVSTLDEDFDIGESIQAGAASGANEHMLFGRFEGALAKYNEIIEGFLKHG